MFMFYINLVFLIFIYVPLVFSNVSYYGVNFHSYSLPPTLKPSVIIF
jgi:hypothetical protein